MTDLGAAAATFSDWIYSLFTFLVVPLVVLFLIKEQAPLKDCISLHCIIGLKQMGDFQKDKEALYDQPDHKIPGFFYS